MNYYWHCFQKLAVAIFTTILFYPRDLCAQIVPDTTLPNNSSVTLENNIEVIGGGAQAGSNLFHSFEQFSVPTNTTAFFNHNANIQNLIIRITGKSISNINGTLRANGTADLFLINPNGIIFGENASLDIGGSFLASTASSINFADGTKFSATSPETSPLLTINAPIGLQFGATPAPIRNQSQAFANGTTPNRPVGLQVPTSKTLALIGGELTLEGGNLTADSGRIELGSLAGNSFVSLNSVDKGWALGYEGVEKFQNIQLIPRNIGDSTIGSTVDVSGKDGNGIIRVQGNSVELIGFPVRLNTITTNEANAGDIRINARKLVVRDGAQIISATSGNGAGGNLTVTTSESVEIVGGFKTSSGNNRPSGLFSAAVAVGKAGNITIKTSKLLIKDGAVISAESSGINQLSQFLPAKGKGGNLTVNASNSVELIGNSATFSSSLKATTSGSANAGNLTISTKQLIVRNGAEITVASIFPEISTDITVIGDVSDLGDAGELNITADSILLDNQSKIISETETGKGGDITLQLKDLLRMRRNSIISTNAGTAELDGDGGNITINVPDGFIVAVLDENSDITANAFTGSGGRVEINATGLLGIQPRSRDELVELLGTNNPSELNPQNLPTSDITAISQQNPNLNGELNITAENVEPTNLLGDLSDKPLDTQISQVCRAHRNNQSEFIYSRRGGLPPLPSQGLRSDSALGVDWVESGRQGDGGTRGRFSIQNSKHPGRRVSRNNIRLEKFGGRETDTTNLEQNRIVEATGWIVDENGDVYFVAGVPSTSRDNSQVVSC